MRYKIISLTFIFVMINTYVFSITTEIKTDTLDKKIYKEFQIGSFFGGMISGTEFSYKSGFTTNLGIKKQVFNNLYSGINIGIEKFKHETYLPLTFDIKCMKSMNKNSSFLSAAFGYSFNVYNQSTILNYNNKCGLLFIPGYGYKIAIQNDKAFYLGISMIFKFVNMEYQSETTIKEKTDYKLLLIKAGIYF